MDEQNKKSYTTSLKMSESVECLVSTEEDMKLKYINTDVTIVN